MSLIDKIAVKHEVVNINGTTCIRSVARLNIVAQNLESFDKIYQADVDAMKKISAMLRAKVVELIELERLEDWEMLKVVVDKKPTVFSVYSEVPDTDAINVAVVCERRKDLILAWERSYPEAKILGDVSKVYRFASDYEPCANCGEPWCHLCDAHFSDCDCYGCDQWESEVGKVDVIALGGMASEDETVLTEIRRIAAIFELKNEVVD
jgi:hypothetical protein